MVEGMECFRVFHPLGGWIVLILKPGRDGWELREMLRAENTSADQFFVLVGVAKGRNTGRIPERVLLSCFRPRISDPALGCDRLSTDMEGE